MRPLLHLLLVLATTALLSCGGGSSNWPLNGPLWVFSDLKVADLDGDGRADLISAAWVTGGGGLNGEHVQVRLQAAPGAFRAADDYRPAQEPWRFALADLDGDGAPDLVYPSGEGTMVWMRQDPAARGRFLAPAAVPGVAVAGEVAVADFNGDGAVDLAIAGPAQVLVAYNDPAAPGTFPTSDSLAAGGRPVYLTAGALDGDGRIGICAWISTTPSVSSPSSGFLAWAGRTATGFAPFQTVHAWNGFNPVRIALGAGAAGAELLAYLRPDNYLNHDWLTALVRNPDGSFTGPVGTDVSGIPGRDDVVFADLDGDGRTDAALVGTDANVHSTVTILHQNADGTFTPRQTLALANIVNLVAAGDLDGDGLLDLVVVDSDNHLYWLRQSPAGSFQAAVLLP